MPDASEPNAEETVLDQTYALLEYLSAVAREVGPKPTRDIRNHEPVIWPSAVPNHRAVVEGPREHSRGWLSVQRAAAPKLVDVPIGLAELIHPTRAQLTPTITPELVDDLVEERADELILAELGPIDPEALKEATERRSDLRTGLVGDIRREFNEWVQGTWTSWVELNRPTHEARELYSRLYDLHLRAESDAATHEVVWGQLVLGARTESGAVVAPMLTTSVTVEVDAHDATIRVVPEHAVELELNAIEGTELTGLEALVTLQAMWREAPPNVWDNDERQEARERIIAPMGLDAGLVGGVGIPAPTNAPRLNDGWVLFLRRRSLRQERFYDELAHKIRAENFLPEGLASVVADSDRVASALVSMGRTSSENDGTAERLLMPLPANAEQERIARQLASSRGVTVQGPPGTGKSHTIVNLVSHLVAQGKRVLVTAEKEQALSVLRDKIPAELRDLSIAVLGSTPSAMEELRNAAQAMQDSLSSLDTAAEERRLSELGIKLDELRESIVSTDATLVRALQSEQREFRLPSGPTRAPQVAEWLANHRELDVISDKVPVEAPFPITIDEFDSLGEILRSVSVADAEAAIRDLPDAEWIPSSADLQTKLSRRESLRCAVSALEDRGLRVEAVDALTPDAIRETGDWFRTSAQHLRGLSGEWEDRFTAAIRGGDPAATWVMEHNGVIRQKLAAAREFASRLTGHVIEVPEGNPTEQVQLLNAWGERISAGKKLPLFAAKALKEMAAVVRVDGAPVTTPAQLEMVHIEIALRGIMRDAHIAMLQTYAACQIPVPAMDKSFRFVADQQASKVDSIHRWWTETAPTIAERLRHFSTTHSGVPTVGSLESMAGLLEGAAARLEERHLSSELQNLADRLYEATRDEHASPLWGALYDALDFSRSDEWGRILCEVKRLAGVRTQVLRAEELGHRVAEAGAPRWARAIVDSRGSRQVMGDIHDAPLAWERAKARTWLAELHRSTNIEALMEKSRDDARDLRRTIVDFASRSARTELKKNSKDRQRRALETWLTAVKRVGKGTGKNAPRFQAAAREALPAAMGAVPVWIMPIYRVLENFDPRESELFDVVVVDESSQCDLLSLGVLALGKKVVVVGDDKQTTPGRVGIQTDRISALQDQYMRGMPEAKLLTLDDSLYSISGRAFPSTIALREHFRCVPEIIGFSNRYYGGQILPLREADVPQIGEPLRVVHLESAVSTKTGTSRVNRDEARAIAREIENCVNNPAYEGLTFGVVTMMSGPQSQIIQDMVREAIGDAEFERRRLRVGNPPLFQGDERNVMFVSMVAHDSSFGATTSRYAQWANVAASRAQDQLWIFHSMDPATLTHEDQRRAMIDYAQGWHRGAEAEDLYSRTDSQLERDVLTQLLERDFDVEPQHRVGSYRIDLVVNVARGERLAIECDGDSFHGPEKWEDDVRRQRVLERLGWSFWRVRASKYYLDPQEALEPLWNRLDEMRRRVEQAEDLARVSREVRDAKQIAGLRADAVEALATVTADESTAATNHVDTSSDLSRPRGHDAGTDGASRFPMAISNPAIRAWARQVGYPIGDRGRIPEYVREAFHDAHRTVADHAPAPAAVSAPGSHRGLPSNVHSEFVELADVDPEPSATASSCAWVEHGDNHAAATLAWDTGASYQMDTQGNISPLHQGQTLASVSGQDAALAVRDLMRRVRPHGGRFKVDERGVMATLTNGQPVYVCTVSHDCWFPAHWNRG